MHPNHSKPQNQILKKYTKTKNLRSNILIVLREKNAYKSRKQYVEEEEEDKEKYEKEIGERE